MPHPLQREPLTRGKGKQPSALPYAYMIWAHCQQPALQSYWSEWHLQSIVAAWAVLVQAGAR